MGFNYLQTDEKLIEIFPQMDHLDNFKERNIKSSVFLMDSLGQ